uniref:Uncharacterized protein n=1 Tax=Monodon monoceros TaxID=40151 RepID=A0A8C6BPK4_MONMO
MSLFADDMFAYVENLKDSTKNLLELVSNYSKVAGCKDTIHMSIAFYTPAMNNWNLTLKT